MSTPPDPGLYDLFVSYSTKDNRPPPGGKVGWVHAFITRLREMAVPFTSENVTTTGDADAFPDWDTFYAPDEIHAGNLWEPRLRTAVAHSRVLLACLSPNYWQSKWCRFEWETYLENESARGLANQVGGITPIYFVNAPGLRSGDIIAQAPAWARDLLAARQVRLVDFSDHGDDLLARLTALRESAEAGQRVSVIATRVAQQISHARRAERGQVGNIALGTDTFVGREAELGQLENQLFGAGALGVITALRGIGGQGKTALALRYGQNLRARYSGGCWQAGAEGARELLPVVATLREPLGLPASAQENEVATARRVLGELHRRAHDPAFPRLPGHPAAALLLLDNVDHAALLARPQRDALLRAMAPLGPDPGWLHLLATTRLEKSELSFLADQQIVPVDALPADKALELWQRISGSLPAPELDAARAIIAVVERHTLTIEIAVRHIRRTIGETSVTYLARLSHALANGPTRLARLLSGQQEKMQDRDLPTYAHPLAATLGFTFDHLATEDPSALAILHYAAHFPAEAVPLPWLRNLAGKHHRELLLEPEAFGLSTAWDRAVLRLSESLRLLTSADTEVPEVVRLHRLAGTYLRAAAEDASVDTTQVTEVEAFIVGRCALAEHSHQARLQPWERAVLLPDLLARMENPACKPGIAVAGIFFGRVITDYTDLKTARRFTSCIYAVLIRIGAKNTANAPWQSSLCGSLNALGALAVAQGDMAAALSYISEAKVIAERFYDNDPDNAEWALNLANSFFKLGDIAAAQNDLPSAARHFSAQKAIADRFVDNDHGEIAWQNNLAASLSRLGNLALAQGDLTTALRHYSESNAIDDRLATRNPDNSLLHENLSVSLEKLGNLAVAQENLAAAFKYFSAVKDSREKLAALEPENAEHQFSYAASWCKIGELVGRLGYPDETLRCFVEGLDIVRQLAARDPTNVRWQTHYAGFLSNVVIAAHKAGKPAAIDEVLNEAWAILSGLEASHKLPPVGLGRELFNRMANSLKNQKITSPAPRPPRRPAPPAASRAPSPPP